MRYHVPFVYIILITFLLINTESILFNYGNTSIIYNLKLIIYSIGLPYIFNDLNSYKCDNYINIIYIYLF